MNKEPIIRATINMMSVGMNGEITLC